MIFGILVAITQMVFIGRRLIQGGRTGRPINSRLAFSTQLPKTDLPEIGQG
jgi:hypothetical protein